MSTIAERIIKIVESTGGNMSAFARRIDVTPAYISKLKNEPDRVPSDRTLSDICKEFNVNMKWLRDGVGPMFMPSPDEDIAYINDLLNEIDNPFIETIKAIMIAYNECSPEDQKILKNFAKSFANKTQKENRD